MLRARRVSLSICSMIELLASIHVRFDTIWDPKNAIASNADLKSNAVCLISRVVNLHAEFPDLFNT